MKSKSGDSLKSQLLLEGGFVLAVRTVTQFSVQLRDPAGSGEGAGAAMCQW